MKFFKGKTSTKALDKTASMPSKAGGLYE